LTQGNPDHSIAESGTIGCFLSTFIGEEGQEEEEGEKSENDQEEKEDGKAEEDQGEDEKDEEEGDEDEDQDNHYAITIRHILQDGTTKAVLESDTDEHVVSIPPPFQRLMSMPAFLRYSRELRSFRRLAVCECLLGYQ
jgi:cobalamin biosynthesis protein CobT